jgi:hypothetical protein
LPHVDESDAAHVEQILTQGCPSKISFEELSVLKALIVCKGNYETFKLHLEVGQK